MTPRAFTNLTESDVPTIPRLRQILQQVKDYMKWPQECTRKERDAICNGGFVEVIEGGAVVRLTDIGYEALSTSEPDGPPDGCCGEPLVPDGQERDVWHCSQCGRKYADPEGTEPL